MARKYPTRKNVTFILAEDVRAEANKKLMLAGVYNSAYIRVFTKPTDERPANLHIMFLFMFRDGEGEFETRIAIIDPDGEKLVASDLGRKSKLPKSSLAMAYGLIGPHYKKLGTYKAIIQLDDRSYEFEFDIDLEEKRQ